MRLRTRGFAFVAAALLLASCGGDGGATQDDAADRASSPTPAATYADNGVTFEYPGSWQEFSGDYSTSAGGNELWSVTVGPDRTNLVNVTAYQLNVAVSDENLDAIQAELETVIGDLVDQAGGEITSGPTATDVAGLPAYSYTWEGVEVDGEAKDSTAYFVFKDDVEYFVNCQFSDALSEEIESGCDQIVGSLAVTAEA